MTQKLLIANRGEIAVRIIHACRELGIASAAVYSDVDAGALHVRLADDAIHIGAAPAVHSYLNAQALLDAARRTGATMLHPGYGFLSEHAEFAERCRAAGLIFVGPSEHAMRLMGDKAAARTFARSLGVPTVQGYDAPAQSDRRMAVEAGRIGYPVLVKAAMGGGGMAMHAVATPSDLKATLAQARREAVASFGDDRLILERLLVRPRHVEVQILGDERGGLIALGERDCSTQRRRQKVIEEAPSPAVTQSTRDRLCELALRIGAAAGYTNAGTMEFLLDEDGAVYFLEMNTRLQVEHPVTEAVFGVDLVRLQLEVAQGGAIESGVAATPRGHAIESRIYAEDPAHGFVPATGRLLGLRWPEGPGVRNDIGFAEGDEISPYYDAILGKLIVWAPDRNHAIRRMQRALADCRIVGLPTNVDLLRRIFASEAFARGDNDINFLERSLSDLLVESGPPPAAFAAAGAFVLLRGSAERASADPWRAFGPWRVDGSRGTLTLQSDGASGEVRARHDQGFWSVDSGGETWRLERSPGEGAVTLEREGIHRAFDVVKDGPAVWVASHDGSWRFDPTAGPSTRSSRLSGAGASSDITAPMPGVVRRVDAAVGQAVRAHQVLVVLEAMKMEHAIEAPADGIVSAVYCEAGDLVQAGSQLVDLRG